MSEDDGDGIFEDVAECKGWVVDDEDFEVVGVDRGWSRDDGWVVAIARAAVWIVVVVVWFTGAVGGEDFGRAADVFDGFEDSVSGSSG